MHGWPSDLRYLVRGLIRTPVSTVAILLTLVVCFAACTSIFGVVDAVLLSPLPFDHPDRLVAIWTRTASHERTDVAPADFRDFRRGSRAFSDIAAVSSDWGVNWSDRGQSARLQGAIVSSNLLSVLGVRPFLGPGFGREHDLPNGEHAVLLGYRLWRSRFGGSPGIVGKSIVLDRVSYTVRGVLPASLHFPTDDADLWLPPSYLGEEGTLRGERFLWLVGRLQPHVGLGAARSELDAIARRLAAEYPATNTGRSVSVAPLRDALVGELKAPLYVLLAAVGCMLLIACTNISALVLGRALRRRREAAVRAALGARTMSLVCRPLIEGTLLTLVGGAGGLLVASAALRVVGSLGSALPRSWEIGVDGRVVAVAVLVSLCGGFVVGALPAYWSARADLGAVLAAGGRGTTVGRGAVRTGEALIVGQVVLSVLLLVGAGLLTRSFRQLIEVPPGFDPSHAVTMRVCLPDPAYDDIADRRSFYRRLLAGVAAMPGVEAVGATSRLPMSMSDITSDLVIDGRPAPEPAPLVGQRSVSERYFAAMRIPLVAGRPFAAGDGLDPRNDVAVIVNQTLARQYWPGESPLGRRIWLGDHDASSPWMTIVGVVGDVHHLGLDQAPEPEVFLPGSYKAPEGMTLVVRTTANPAILVAEVRRAVRAIDPTVPAYQIDLLSNIVDRSLAKRRLAMELLLIFAGLAFLLTLVGIYGSIAEWTVRHRREIAIRLAIGARRDRVVGLVVGRGMALTGAGVIIGLAIALAGRRMMQSLLFGVSSGDPVTFLTTPVLVAALALIAISFPAWRSARLDPNEVLRED